MTTLPNGKTLLRRYQVAQVHYPNLTHEQHATMMGMTYSVYMARLNEYRPVFSLGQPLKLSGDWMISGDWHVPFTDFVWVERLLTVARREEIKNLLIAGDFLNMDTFSQYPHITDKIPGWSEERDMARALFAEFRGVFEQIVVLMGNHERRAQKFTLGAFDDLDVFALITTTDKLTTSPFGYCTVGDWRVTHPKNYGINQLTVLDQLAWKFRQNIIGFHEHHLSMGWDRYGHYVIVNGGCLVDPERLAYVTMDDNKAAAMKNGFVALKNNTPNLYGSEPMTDWSKWI